jgi:hypothetical protein
MSSFDNDEDTMEYYILNIFARVIRLEEIQFEKMSGMRLWCRMDVSVYREKETGKHQFFVNEITRSHTAALFPRWDSSDLLDRFFYRSLARSLHHVAALKLFDDPPRKF